MSSQLTLQVKLGGLLCPWTPTFAVCEIRGSRLCEVYRWGEAEGVELASRKVTPGKYAATFFGRGGSCLCYYYACDKMIAAEMVFARILVG